jgi:alcohol dehydrogenase (cytochrome c)
MVHKLRLGLAGSMSVLLATTALPALAVTDADLVKDDQTTDNVLMNGMGYQAQRFSPLDKINKDTVKKLVPAWTLSFGGEKQRGQESQPIVVDGTLYVTGSYSRIWAVDARTGEEK